MKLEGREQIEQLAEFRGNDFLTTSFYLNTDKSRKTKKEINLSFKNLLNKYRVQVNKMDISQEKKDSLNRDLDKIHRFFTRNASSYKYPGLAVFSCSRKAFWQIFNLPESPRDRIVFDLNPYVRPLSVMVDEFHLMCTLLVDRREARWFKVYMGEISLLESLITDVPRKVKEGGWEGYESKRIERHVANILHEHLKNAAQITFSLFKKNQYDWLVLGCKEEQYTEFENLLHPYLKKKLKGKIKAKPGDPLNKVLKESFQLERRLKKQEENEIVNQLISELEKGGLAVSGIKDTLRKLNCGEVQTLVLIRNFAKQGKICPKCRFLFLDELRCPSCQVKTDKVVDVIDEAVESAMEKNCRIKHIVPPSALRRYGNIGAFLRYKT